MTVLLLIHTVSPLAIPCVCMPLIHLTRIFQMTERQGYSSTSVGNTDIKNCLYTAQLPHKTYTLLWTVPDIHAVYQYLQCITWAPSYLHVCVRDNISPFNSHDLVIELIGINTMDGKLRATSIKFHVLLHKPQNNSHELLIVFGLNYEK